MSTRSPEFGLDALAVTPSDTQDLVRPSQGHLEQTNANPNFIGAGGNALSPKAQTNFAVALSVGVAGNVVIIDGLGNTQTIVMSSNEQFFMRVSRVKATGTTATGITAYFPIFE